MPPEDEIELLKHGDRALMEAIESYSIEGNITHPSSQMTPNNLFRFALGQWKYSIAGASAGCTSAFITCPLDVVKTRLQNQGTTSFRNHPYSGTFHTLKRIYLEEGIRGNFRGLAPTLLGYLPSWTIYFSTYHRFKDLLADTLHSSAQSPLVHMLSAMGAGATSTISTNPLWVVKTRLMTQTTHSNYHYRNTWHALYMLFKVEGIRGFYRGLAPSLLGILHVAVQFPLYERFKQLLIKSGNHIKVIQRETRSP
jgi:solute carrier family 25 (mitochondrial folate transporter), member 32